MTTEAPRLIVEPVYEGSDIAILAAALQPLCQLAPIFVGAGEASRNAGPPRIVFVGPLTEEYSQDKLIQPVDGRASVQALEDYDVECWGATLEGARELRDIIINALISVLSLKWNLEIVKGSNDGGSQGLSSWMKTIHIRVAFPIYSVRYQRAHIDDGQLHGVLVGQLVPPDPNAEPIPGLE